MNACMSAVFCFAITVRQNLIALVTTPVLCMCWLSDVCSKAGNAGRSLMQYGCTLLMWLQPA
jgi:hypothetical protein